MLNKMANFSITSPKDDSTAAKRPKFKQSVSELTKTCDFKKPFSQQSSAVKTGGQSVTNSRAKGSRYSSTWKDFTNDKKSLRSVIKMCLNTDYMQQMEGEQEHKNRRNKATFEIEKKKSMTDDHQLDQNALAFRKGAQKALNVDNVLTKKSELHCYVEKLRNEANKEIFEFFETIDPKTEAKYLKLLYFYFVGSRNLL